MKSLRIITGFHSGAQLDLPAGSHTIGTGCDDDIRITDWTAPTIELVVDDQSVQLRRNECIEEDESAAGLGDPVTVDDFVPAQFGDIVMCVGPADVEWPSDVELLSTLFVKPDNGHQPAERRPYRRGSAIAGVTACCVALLASLSLWPAQPAKASAPVDLAARVRDAVAHANVRGLAVERAGDDIAITGMVPNYADDVRVRKALADIEPSRVKRRYSVAENDVQNIQDALGIAGANVAYRGNGTFEIDGTVASLKALDAAVARVRSDLTANVKDILVRATEIQKPEVRQVVSQLISANGVRYTQTPDGVKHIYASGS
ncbi:type III secretion system protein [Burkholderia sp. AW49-1]